MLPALAIAASTLAILSDDEPEEDLDKLLERAWLSGDPHILLDEIDDKLERELIDQLYSSALKAENLDDLVAKIEMLSFFLLHAGNLVRHIHPEQTILGQSDELSKELGDNDLPKFGGKPVFAWEPLGDYNERYWNYVQGEHEVLILPKMASLLSWDETRILIDFPWKEKVKGRNTLQVMIIDRASIKDDIVKVRDTLEEQRESGTEY